jgi:proton-translocating NADH-quinone oxidoreductase chain M
MIDYVLSLMILLPIVGAAIAFTSGRANVAKYAALICSAIPLALSLWVLVDFNIGLGNYQYMEQYSWISTDSLTMQYIVGIDGLSLPMVFLTSLLGVLVVIFSWGEHTKAHQYYGLLLTMEAGLFGVYLALDYFVFYIFWEVTLIPMYFLIARWGGPRRAYASIKFFIYTHVASLVMLLGIFALYFETGSFSFEVVGSSTFSEAFQILLFGVFFFGFGVKMPIVPFHTWLPDAHVEAPTAGSVLLAALMLKMGSYGIIRIGLDVFPEGALAWQPVLLVIAIVSILYGAFACIAQRDLKKMVAFSSISHMGMVLLGIATLSSLGISAAIFQMFAHGLVTAVLFMVCGIMGHNAGTREIPLLGGMAQKMPNYSAYMMIGFMASLGLPGLVGFVAEFSVMTATYDAFDWVVILPLISIPLTAGYYLWAMQRSIFGDLTKKIDLSHVKDVSWFEALPLAILCLLLGVFGVFPNLMFDYLQPFAQALYDGVLQPVVGSMLGVL